MKNEKKKPNKHEFYILKPLGFSPLIIFFFLLFLKHLLQVIQSNQKKKLSTNDLILILIFPVYV